MTFVSKVRGRFAYSLGRKNSVSLQSKGQGILTDHDKLFVFPKLVQHFSLVTQSLLYEQVVIWPSVCYSVESWAWEADTRKY